MRATTTGKYTSAALGAQGKAYSEWVQYMKGQDKAQHKYDKYVFIAHADTFNSFRIGADISTAKFPNDVAKYINPTMLDLAPGQPKIDVYLPGCDTAGRMNGAKLLGLKRNKSEQGIRVHTSEFLTGYDGAGGLNGDHTHDMKQINDIGTTSRYGVWVEKGKPERWETRQQCSGVGKPEHDKLGDPTDDYIDSRTDSELVLP